MGKKVAFLEKKPYSIGSGCRDWTPPVVKSVEKIKWSDQHKFRFQKSSIYNDYFT